jgi:hypothetical protein
MQHTRDEGSLAWRGSCVRSAWAGDCKAGERVDGAVFRRDRALLPHMQVVYQGHSRHTRSRCASRCSAARPCAVPLPAALAGHCNPATECTPYNVRHTALNMQHTTLVAIPGHSARALAAPKPQDIRPFEPLPPITQGWCSACLASRYRYRLPCPSSTGVVSWLPFKRRLLASTLRVLFEYPEYPWPDTLRTLSPWGKLITVSTILQGCRWKGDYSELPSHLTNSQVPRSAH